MKTAHALLHGDSPYVPPDAWSNYVLSRIREDGKYPSIILPVLRR